MAVTTLTTLTGTLYSYNSGWTSGNIGSTVGYVSVSDSTAARTYLKFTIPAPSAGYKIKTITLQIGLVFNNGGSTTLTGYLYTTEPNQVTDPPSGYIATATTGTYTLSSSGENKSMTFTIPDSYRWTTSQTVYVWLCTSLKGYIQVWAKDNSSGSDWLVPRYKTEDTPAGVVRIRVGTEWKMAIPYVRVGSSWKQAIPYVRVGDKWKIGT